MSAQQRQAARLLDRGCGGPLQVVLELAGPLDVPRLRAACVGLVARHRVLQGASGNGHGAMWSVCDLSATSSAARGRWRERAVAARGGHVALEPIRILLLRLDDHRHELILTCSPLAADAPTLRQCCRELLDDYHGVDRHGDAPLSYDEVVAWQESLLEDDEAQAGSRYWSRQPRVEEEQQLPIPTVAATPDAADRRRRMRSISLKADAAFPIDVARRPAFWLACWQTLFYRLSNGTRFLTGVVVNARRYDELQDVIGPLDRTVPVPSTLRDADTVAKAIAALDTLLRDHVTWQEYAPEESPCQVGFAYVRWPEAFGRPPMYARPVHAIAARTGAEIDLVVHELAVNDTLRLELRYDRSQFAPRDVRMLGRRLLTLAGDAAARPNASLDTLRLLTADERRQITVGWNATDRDFGDRTPATLLEWVESYATRSPEEIAVSAEDGTWSYAVLHDTANRIARRLRRLGVGAESRVGVWIPRSRFLVASLVAVIKAGAAYVPLDPSYPAARLAFQVSDADVIVILTTTEFASVIPEGPYVVEVLDAPDAAWRDEEPTAPIARVSPEQLAYVIYTSGSTGQPKGAMNSHRGIANRLAWMQSAYELTSSDRVLQKTSSSFDVSVWEFFWALGVGATVVVARPGRQHDPGYLASLIAREQVTVLHFVPAMLEAFVTAGGLAACASVRLIVSSGEALSGSLAARCRVAGWSGRLENLYGPTEAAVDVTSHACVATDDDYRSVPIGRPIANTQVYVRERGGEPVPVGVGGELFLGGVQVGRGYWRRPDLTAERFVPDPFSATPGTRLYRTGDLGRYRSDGAIEYIGRSDHQVKLHGNRIELSEIEAVLRQQADVREAVVLLRDDDPDIRRLVAYVVANPAAVSMTGEQLQLQLKAQLPEYMIPAVVMLLSALPLTPNGKVDRKALPKPSGERPTLTVDYTGPRTAVEATLAGIWAEVLRLDRVGIHDNFFSLGGDSIISLQLVARAMQAGWQISPRLVFEHPTIAGLAAVAQISTGPRADQAPLVGPVPLTPIQHWFFSHRLPVPQHFNQAARVELPEPLLPLIDAAWLALQRHHDALRFRFARETSGWRQTGTSVDTASHVSTIDLRAVAPNARPTIESRLATAAQRSLDLTNGPVVHAMVLLAADRSPHALMVIHHLIVDGVSWRVLLSDFELATRQLRAGQPIALPPKTSSVREWTTALTAGDSANALQTELPFWLDMSAPAAALPRDRADGLNTIRSSGTDEVSLSPEDTQSLLQDLPARGAGHVLEVLLTALVRALSTWAGGAAWRIDLEGHGREPLADGIDVSRTVGWFTSLYPVRLTAEATPAATLTGVKRTLRSVPRNGVGYGVLRYLDIASGADFRDRPDGELLVNYLGQVDQAIAPGASLRPAPGPTGFMRDPNAPREYLLELNGIAIGGQLRLSWTYSTHFESSSIARLIELFQRELRIVITDAQTGAADDTIAPSDLRHVALDEDEFSRIARLLDLGELA